MCVAVAVCGRQGLYLVVVAVGHGIRVHTIALHLLKNLKGEGWLMVSTTQLHEYPVTQLQQTTQLCEYPVTQQ